MNPPPLPAGESALLVDDSELLVDDTPAPSPESVATGERADGGVEQRVIGITAKRASGRELDITFLADVYFFADFELDISVGGAFLPTYAAFEVGELIELWLELGADVVRVEARVRWGLDGRGRGHRPGYALFFERVEAEALSALERHCRVFPPRFYEL